MTGSQTSDPMYNHPITIGVGACLEGAACLSCQAKKSNPALTQLGHYFALQASCPALASGLGVPKASLYANGNSALQQNPHLCGFVLIDDTRANGSLANDAPSFGSSYAGDPLLPLEASGRLQDAELRESFVLRVLTYHQWRVLLRDGLSYAALQDFYVRRKYLLMSRHIGIYKQLGRLLAIGPTVANDQQQNLAALAQQIITLIMSALTRPATRGGHTNTLMHIRGYLKKTLSVAEKAELGAAIEQYRRSQLPLAAPLTLLRQHFAQHPNAYIERQLFMQPHPAVLRLHDDI
jgi:uncharacterized protein YbgA (DUF1722 family)